MCPPQIVVHSIRFFGPPSEREKMIKQQGSHTLCFFIRQRGILSSLDHQFLGAKEKPRFLTFAQEGRRRAIMGREGPLCFGNDVVAVL